MEIWITTKFEPQVVSWSKLCFLAVDMEPLIGYQFDAASFVVDEEKKAAVVVDLLDVPRKSEMVMLAYIIGEDGYFKKEDLRAPSNNYFYPLVYPFVPSLAPIKLGGKRKRKRKKHQILC
ncbi:unnamed protein product [Microthlaspi erraticum]|nr:unnamed protein product [Microthlaspi erraticum]CAA7053084.1 unnamed protein product [Microthlaspi erraticum]